MPNSTNERTNIQIHRVSKRENKSSKCPTKDHFEGLATPSRSSLLWSCGRKSLWDIVIGVIFADTTVWYNRSSASAATIEVHSSSTAKEGRWKRTRLSASRCCSPPDNWSSQSHSKSHPSGNPFEFSPSSPPSSSFTPWVLFLLSPRWRRYWSPTSSRAFKAFTSSPFSKRFGYVTWSPKEPGAKYGRCGTMLKLGGTDSFAFFPAGHNPRRTRAKAVFPA